MNITNKFNLPDPVVRALKHDDYTRGDSNRSVTQLIDSPRVRILKKEHRDEIAYDASELIWVALGKAVHRMFEDHGVGKWRPEERLFAEVGGWRVSGQIDIQFDEDVVNGRPLVSLYDYKVTSVHSLIYWKASYDQQQNFYAWLCEQNGMSVHRLFIVFIFRDWKKNEALKGGDYPESPILCVPANLWTPQEQNDYVDERVRVHQEAEYQRLTEGILPPCTDEERWKSAAQFAVKKPKNKRARRVLGSYDEAAAYMKENNLSGEEFVIEERPAEPKRCAGDWCPAAPWCDQWQAELEAVNG